MIYLLSLLGFWTLHFWAPLLFSHITPSLADKFNCSPLSEALRLGQQSTAELLQEHGADVTPRVAAYDLCTAIADGNVRHVDLLLRFGADPDCWDYDGKTALQIATTLVGIISSNPCSP